MSKSLEEYADWLDTRDLLWPEAPDAVPVKATPYLKPFAEVRAVIWSLYGMLLRIGDGRLHLLHPQPMPMQIALEKTIHEFNMWNSMSRKPGQPWEYMLQQYTRLVEDERLAASPRKGESTEVDAAKVWAKIIERLGQKEYQWDEDLYGELEEYSEKIAYFFHSFLQGVAAMPDAYSTLMAVCGAGFTQGIVGDGQVFSLLQLTRALRKQGTLPSLRDLFPTGTVSLSYQAGVRQPAASLFERTVKEFARNGLEPKEIVYISPRLGEELAVARKLGLRTALFCGDQHSLQAAKDEVNRPELRPDRILTGLSQVLQILGLNSGTPRY